MELGITWMIRHIASLPELLTVIAIALITSVLCNEHPVALVDPIGSLLVMPRAPSATLVACSPNGNCSMTAVI
jgi:hypothetical protein